MRIAFISDLHLAIAHMNRCTTPIDELCALVRRLLDEHDRVVVLGDAYDLLRPTRPRGWRRQLEALRTQHPELMDLLERCEGVYGNHDAPLSVLGCPEQRVYHGTEVGTVLAMHGHQWDVWLKKVWGMEESANFVAGWCERVSLGPVSTLMGRAPLLLERLQYVIKARVLGEDVVSKDDSERWDDGPGPVVEGRMNALFDERGLGCLVTGHSHRLGMWARDEGGLWINTGSHAHGYRDWAWLDTGQGRAQIVRDDQVKATAQLGEGGAWRVCVEGADGAP